MQPSTPSSIVFYLQVLGFRQSAVASIYLIGESLRSGDLVQSMLYAQKVIHDAPEAYDGYQLAGEVYRRQRYNVGAVAMYEAAIDKLKAGGTKSMLVEDGVISVATAEEHLRQKLKSEEHAAHGPDGIGVVGMGLAFDRSIAPGFDVSVERIVRSSTAAIMGDAVVRARVLQPTATSCGS